ncbi:MAG: type II secretion system protein [Planctomycetota bacterium]
MESCGRERMSEAPRRGSGPAPSPGGFTLTELIVVMAIVSILSGLVLGGVMAARKRGAVMSTQTFITQLEAAINQYEVSYGDYPHGAGGVESAELLHQALTSRSWTGRGEYDPDKFRDTDGNGRPEFVDHWLQPVIYHHHRSYYGPPREATFRLISIGPDAEEGTRDDITNYR